MAFALPCPASKIGTYASDTMHTIQAWSIAAIKQLYAKFNGIYGVSRWSLWYNGNAILFIYYYHHHHIKLQKDSLFHAISETT
jgi:hypothetical protein